MTYRRIPIFEYNEELSSKKHQVYKSLIEGVSDAMKTDKEEIKLCEVKNSNTYITVEKPEWKKKYPEWGAFRKMQVDIMNNSQTLNALVFAHNKDKWEDQETLSFLKNFKDLNFVDYSDLKPTSCTWADVDRKMESNKGHSIPQSKCFTKYVEKNNYFINYIETLF